VAKTLQDETECVKNLDEASSPELFHSPQRLISIRHIVIAIIIAAAASASINSSKAALSLSHCAKLLGVILLKKSGDIFLSFFLGFIVITGCCCCCFYLGRSSHG
jgi:hypothetical protein